MKRIIEIEGKSNVIAEIVNIHIWYWLHCEYFECEKIFGTKINDSKFHNLNYDSKMDFIVKSLYDEILLWTDVVDEVIKDKR